MNRVATGSAREPIPNHEPFVSVVVPVYENAPGIRRALAALLEQDYPSPAYEVIVVDNGSSDETPDVVLEHARRHPARVRLERETAVRSSYAARNCGIRVAQGSVLAFTDSDCIPTPQWLTEGVRALTATDAGFAGGRVVMTFAGPQPNPWEYYDAVANLNQRRYVEDLGFGATANLFVRRDVLDRHGLFREDLRSGGDYELGRRLTRSGEQSVYADRAVVCHPARDRPGDLLSKGRRIAVGQKRLESLGLLEHGRLSWRSLVPVRRCPRLPDRPKPSLLHRAAYLLMTNTIRYYSLFLRLLPDRSSPSASGGQTD